MSGCTALQKVGYLSFHSFLCVAVILWNYYVYCWHLISNAKIVLSCVLITFDRKPVFMNRIFVFKSRLDLNHDWLSSLISEQMLMPPNLLGICTIGIYQHFLWSVAPDQWQTYNWRSMRHYILPELYANVYDYRFFKNQMRSIGVVFAVRKLALCAVPRNRYQTRKIIVKTCCWKKMISQTNKKNHTLYHTKKGCTCLELGLIDFVNENHSMCCYVKIGN